MYCQHVARRGTSDTIAEDVHRSLRAAIFAGQLRPGQALRPTELSVQFAASVSVVREALTRLVEQRLATFRPNRGFSVVRLSRKDLDDLVTVRLLNEGNALSLATQKGDLEWQAKVLSVHHLLSNTDHFDPENDSIVREEWSAAHRRFHMTLLEACDNPLLINICAELFDAAELYRRWSVPSSPRKRADNEHTGILNAVISGDADLALDLYEQHIRRTASLVLATPD